MVARDITDSTDIAAPAKIPFWHDPTKRAIIYQAIVLGMVGMVGYYLFTNTQANLERQSIATGFGFFAKEASFEIGESPIPYSAADTYARALLVGVLNTLKVSFIGIILTVILGTFVGIARLSNNWLVSKLAGIFIEVMQDIPVLLHLFFWYVVSYETLPSPRQALNPVTGVFLSNRGLVFAVPEPHPVHGYMVIAFFGRVFSSLGAKTMGKKATRENRPAFSCLCRVRSHSCEPASHGLAVWWYSSEDECSRTKRFQLSGRPHDQP